LKTRNNTYPAPEKTTTISQYASMPKQKKYEQHISATTQSTEATHQNYNEAVSSLHALKSTVGEIER
jgi:hypothetical protein